MFSLSEKHRSEKTSYSYIAHAVWNNKNDPKKSIGISKSDNVTKKIVKNSLGRDKKAITFMLHGNWLMNLLLDI